MKEIRGKFYKRVLLGILWPVLIFIIIAIIAISFLLLQLDESGNDSRHIIFSRQKNAITAASVSLEKTLSNIISTTHDAWIDSKDDNLRYYYSTQAYNTLTKVGVSLDQTPIDISIIVDFDPPMIMTYNGSADFDWYSKNYVNLSDEQLGQIMDLLKSRKREMLALSVYDSNDALTDVYVVLPYDTDKGGRMLIVSRLYIKDVFEIADNEDAYIVFGKSIVPYYNTESSGVFLQKNAEKILSYEFVSDNKTTFSTIFSNPWIQFIAVFNNKPSYLYWVTIAIIITLSLLAIGTLIVLLQTKHIYKPVSAAISTDDRKESSYDEFEIIRKRREQIEELSTKLRKVLEERDQLEETRYYRFLLDGTVDASDKNDKDNYIVVLVQFNDAERGVDVQYFQLTLESRNTIYVPYGFNRFALIYKNCDINTTRKDLDELLGEISNEATFNASISDPVEGEAKLKYAFNQCLHLLSFTTLLRTYRIITSSDMPAQIKDFYHYSAQTEAKLISLVALGVPQAKNEYDCIVEENISDKTLSEKTKLEFAYCMVFTIQRIFSELNKSPREVIGEDINFSAMLWQRSYKAVLAETKDIIYKIIDNTHNMSSESDAQLILRMKKYIHENYMYDIGLQDLADCFNITPKYCGMLFSKLSNDTFKNYLNNYRVEEAKAIIQEEPTIKITDLSLKVGFNSSTSFIRVFSKYTGMTPKVFADQEVLKKQDSIFEK